MPAMTKDEVLQDFPRHRRPAGRPFHPAQRIAQPPVFSVRPRLATNAHRRESRRCPGRTKSATSTSPPSSPPPWAASCSARKSRANSAPDSSSSKRRKASSCCDADSKSSPGERILVVEDVVTKGGRVRETINIVRRTKAGFWQSPRLWIVPTGRSELGRSLFQPPLLGGRSIRTRQTSGRPGLNPAHQTRQQITFTSAATNLASCAPQILAQSATDESGPMSTCLV